MGGLSINSVKAIRDVEEKEEFLLRLKEIDDKYYILGLLGFETGLRVSDILGMKVWKVQRGKFKVKEKKTGKTREIELSRHTKKAIKGYVKGHGMGTRDFIVPSRYSCKDRALNRTQAYKTFKRVAKEMGLSEIGVHSMRKTYAVELYQEVKDLNVVKERLNHENVSTTLFYVLDKAELMGGRSKG